MVQREVFGRMILLGQLKLKVDQVYCLQTNMQEKSFDVTFSSEGIADDVLRLARARAGEKPFSDYDILNLDRPNFRVITVHMYNPYVTSEQIGAFLSAYGEVSASTRKLMDSLGFWTGRTQFQVLLQEDPEGFGGLAHPPAFFNIGADRGFLFYSRQPPFCRRCRKQGHTEGACGFVWCRICTAYGHEPRDCPHRGTCNVCGKAGHFYRDCPQKKLSYAAAAGKGPGDGEASSSRAGNGPIVVAEVEDQQAAEDIFAATEQDTFYDCSQEEERMGSANLPSKKAGLSKKSAVKRLRKTSLALGGNGKAGEGDRGSKRKQSREEGGGELSKGRREEKESVGGGLEDQGSSKPMEADEGLSQETVIPIMVLGDDLSLAVAVSPLPESEGEGDGGAGSINEPWGDHMDKKLEFEDSSGVLSEGSSVASQLPPAQQQKLFGTMDSSSVLPKKGGGGVSGV